MSWEDTFSSWASAPGQTEQDKCDNAVRGVQKAIAASKALAGRDVRVFPQGSYRHRTNVRIESDVDVAVLCTDTIFHDLPAGMTIGDVGLSAPADYPYQTFKNDVEAALVSHFGRASVTRGNKAFDVHENSYRVDADVVACFEHRRYAQDKSFITGTAFLADDGLKIINWPEQNYTNGVSKNDATGRRFKALVRILKRLKYKMVDEGSEAAKSVPSWLIECLAWNVPNEHFEHDTYRADVRAGLAHLFNNTIRAGECQEWGEVNELKYLFRTGQPWTREQAHAFLSEAWDYIGFK